MKRINILIVVLYALIFVACSKPSPSLESIAKERIRPYLENTFKGEGISLSGISNEETIYNGDSICIIHFTLSANDEFGSKASLPMEYVIMWTVASKKFPEVELKEILISIDTEKPLIEFTENLYKRLLPTDKQEKERRLRIMGALRFFSSWKTV